MKRHILVAALALILGGGVAQFHVASQDYYPVVRVSSPEGVTYTAVLDATDERPQCGEVSRRFIQVLKAHCARCQIVMARCENELQGIELATYVGNSSAHPLVRMRGVTIAVDGRLPAAQQGCELVAANAVRLGMTNAKCVASTAQTPHT